MKKFTCARCHGTFISDRPEGEALDELKENFGDVSVDDCAQVCDDCWEEIKPVHPINCALN